jgi:hypothetical protein
MPATLTDREKRLALTPRLVVSGADIQDRPFTERTHALDVSGAGLSFETTHNLTVGTRLHFLIYVPAALRHRFDGRPVYRVRGLVTRVGHAPGTDRHRIGVQLLEDAPDRA